MVEYQNNSHAKYDIKYHIVWITKYRYHVLTKEMANRLKNLLAQGTQSRGITIVKGTIDVDHVHLLLSCPPSLAPSKIVQYLKGRTSHMLQEEFPLLKKRYWGQHLWARGYFCATVGAETEEMIRDYIEKHHEGENPITVTGEFQS